MENDITSYHQTLSDTDLDLCDLLYQLITQNLKHATAKVWHGHPVWFTDDNPIVGYNKLKAGIKLLFWSGVAFNDSQLIPGSGKFKDAGILYQNAGDVNAAQVKHWLKLANDIQWDYKNVVKRKGVLLPLKGIPS